MNKDNAITYMILTHHVGDTLTEGFVEFDDITRYIVNGRLSGTNRSFIYAHEFVGSTHTYRVSTSISRALALRLITLWHDDKYGDKHGIIQHYRLD